MVCIVGDCAIIQGYTVSRNQDQFLGAGFLHFHFPVCPASLQALVLRPRVEMRLADSCLTLPLCQFMSLFELFIKHQALGRQVGLGVWD